MFIRNFLISIGTALRLKPAFSSLDRVFLFRLRTLGLSARVLLFVLCWLVRLVSRFLLRTGLLRTTMLWVAIFLICHLNV